MLELLNHIKNVLVLSGLEGARLDSAMFLIEDKLESTIVLSNTVEVKEPEVKVVEKEVKVEVIPNEVQDELASLQGKNEELNNQIQDLEDKVDDLNDQIKELECDLNDSMTIAETALNDVETLQARCTELYEQNEYLLNQLEQPEEVTFEEPEEVSNEDILANSMNEEVDEEAILNQLEKSLEQVAIEEPEKK